MKNFNVENGKLKNVKPKYFSNYSKYKNILSHNILSKSNSVSYIINKIYLKKNNKNCLNNKRNLLNGNISIPKINSSEFSLAKRKNEKIKERYYVNEKNIFKFLLKKFTKEKESSKLRNFSFSNNYINSKLNQYEDNFKNNKNKLLSEENKSFLDEKKEEKKVINIQNNNNKKNNDSSSNTTNININIKENLNDEEIGKIKIKNSKNEGFNKILNKYISKSIINNLQRFNRIRNLIRTNGFSLNLKDIKNVYKENDKKGEKGNISNRIDTQMMMRIKKLEKVERLKKNKNNSFQNPKEKEKSEKMNKKISRNKILPLIKSEIKEKPNKLRIFMNFLNSKNEAKNVILYNKEIKIKKEVNKYYKENNYKSFKEFYKDLLKNDKNYLTINDIEFFLNKIIKISVSLSREEIIKIFFNDTNMNQIDFNCFKNFFWPNDLVKKNDNHIITEKISNEELIKKEKKICLMILKNKDKLLDKLEDQKDKNNDKYFLTFEEFYNLLKNNLLFYKDNYFDYIIRKLFNDNFDLRTKKINILNFIDKINTKQNNLIESEKNINNSEVLDYNQNKIKKKYFHGINSLKDGIKISFKNKILGKKESLNNSEYKITNFLKLDKVPIKNINNNKEKNDLNKFTKLTILKIDSKSNKKNKNSDIINLI